MSAAFSCSVSMLCPFWMSCHDSSEFTRSIQRAAHITHNADRLLNLFACLLLGDILIYWEHRLMHTVPYLRNHIHSVHHEYTAVFSWAGKL